MKKCSRYLDVLNDSQIDDSGCWQDIIVHAQKCPDCSADMKLRTQMLEMLAEQPEPEYPENLHGAIMENLVPGKESVVGETGFISRALDFILQPLEIIIPVACLVMFAFLIKVEKDTPENTGKYRMTASVRPVKEDHQSSLEPTGQKLERVTVVEVNDFLKQLEEFKRLHPDARQPDKTHKPEIKLVNDFQQWGTP